MRKIEKLDSQIANMIAAGEVVERPMGVVKELVENAIDAKAKRISVSIQEGGIKKIMVSDDGEGMSAEDAEMAFERHATSKIRTQNDLWQIQTMGFRGEALPSIASVSKVTLITSDGIDNTQIKIEYGKCVSVNAYPCNQGTQISVEGLFYQTPARLKHLRSASTEASYIQNVISSFALSHPESAFTLLSDGKENFKTSGQGNLLEVIYQVFGSACAKNSIPVSFKDFDYEVKGYLIKPSITRASRNAMHVFLNGRIVRSYPLTFPIYRAIQDGYEDFIVKGRYPICVLHIEMDPHLLDVNVHPSKWEVRISKMNQLEYLLKDKIRLALRQENLSPEKEIAIAKEYIAEPIAFDLDKLIAEKEEERKKAIYSDVVKEESKEDISYAIEKEKEEDNALLYALEKDVIKEEVKYEPKVEEIKETKSHFPIMEVIGQLHEKFILCAVQEGLVVMDQHAAQERVNYEKFQRMLNQNPAMMELLVPITIHTSADIVSRLEKLNEAISDLHVQFEAFGNDTLLVREVPSWLADLEEEAFLIDVVEAFKEDKEVKYTKMEKKKIATMACHHSIRFNRSLTMQEMKEVVDQLSLCENPYHCPHGRPTFITLEEKELVKEFLR